MVARTTPILVFAYNRPDYLEQLLQLLGSQKNREFIFVCDGPKDSDSDRSLCEAVRSLIVNFSQGHSYIHHFSDSNLGLRDRIISGLDFAFSIHEELIILEDDCLPSLSFFRFCDVLLDVFRFDSRIGMIQGGTFLPSGELKDSSIYLTDRPRIWGWASWRRVHSSYDPNARRWGLESNQDAFLRLHNYRGLELWRKKRDLSKLGTINTWDYQWVLSLWLSGQYSVAPRINLVRNIGFGGLATHTKFNNLAMQVDAKDFREEELQQLALLRPGSITFMPDFDRLEKRNILKTFLKLHLSSPLKTISALLNYLSSK